MAASALVVRSRPIGVVAARFGSSASGATAIGAAASASGASAIGPAASATGATTASTSATARVGKRVGIGLRLRWLRQNGWKRDRGGRYREIDLSEGRMGVRRYHPRGRTRQKYRAEHDYDEPDDDPCACFHCPINPICRGFRCLTHDTPGIGGVPP